MKTSWWRERAMETCETYGDLYVLLLFVQSREYRMLGIEYIPLYKVKVLFGFAESNAGPDIPLSVGENKTA